jgi:STE24 endopeptidase
MSDAFLLVFAGFVLASVLVQVWLTSRQVRHVAQHRNAVPASYQGVIDLAAHQKAAAYTVAKSRLGLVGLALGTVVLIGWTLMGGLNWLNQALLHGLGAGMAQQIALVLAFMAIGGLIDLPLSLYSTFKLEAEYGFNKTSFKLWLVDAIKGTVLSLVIVVPLLWAVLWLMAQAGPLWWLWAWGLIVAFQLLLMAIAPNVIMPLFNKFTPLADDALKTRVDGLMQRCGFKSKGFFVMDGSRRSAHSNAFFTGFGASKRVVFFDTLLEKLNADEMEAVLAHELGHFKHRHIVKRMLGMFVGLGLGLAALGWLSTQVWFYTGLGVRPSLDAPNDALALLLFMLAVPVFMFFVSPWFASRSRRDEFQADAYAASVSNASQLKAALLKLYRDNASTLTPDAWYVRWYYSHPPATQRFAALGV